MYRSIGEINCTVNVQSIYCFVIVRKITAAVISKCFPMQKSTYKISNYSASYLFHVRLILLKCTQRQIYCNMWRSMWFKLKETPKFLSVFDSHNIYIYRNMRLAEICFILEIKYVCVCMCVRHWPKGTESFWYWLLMAATRPLLGLAIREAPRLRDTSDACGKAQKHAATLTHTYINK